MDTDTLKGTQETQDNAAESCGKQFIRDKKFAFPQKMVCIYGLDYIKRLSMWRL